MLNVCCVQAGNYLGRGAEYANVLFDSVRRNLAAGFPGRFVCFTDDPTGLDEGIVARPLPAGLDGWWNKLALFAPGQFAEGDRVLFLDLDTLIVGPLDDIARYDGEFAMLRDFYFPDAQASGVMAWRAGFGHHIWERWVAAGKPDMQGGDQAWIEMQQPRCDMLQDRYPGQLVSYKVHCQPHPPAGARIVCFHGEPRPHNCGVDWVGEVWRVGGYTGPELEVVINTTREQLSANIRHALSLGLPEIENLPANEGAAVLVGGGPSLTAHLPIIRARKANGQAIFALNGTLGYLLEHGIEPDAFVCVDARSENAAFVAETRPDVAHFIASQCHPDLFAALAGRKVVLWHEESTETLLPPGGRLLIGGGTTVGMKAMAIAHTLGFRAQHLYGFDSSYRAEDGHAYAQALNAAEQVIDVWAAGVKFRAAPWMVRQVQDFQTFALALANAGATVSVHGDGLLPFVARQMAEAA